jgi:hypothetical protein
MKYEELAKVSAQYTVAHRELVRVLSDAIALADFDKVSKNNPDYQEAMLAFSQTRLNLIQGFLWYKYLHQVLVPRTDEAKKAAEDFNSKIETQRAPEATPEATPEVAAPAVDVPPAPEAVPAEPAQEEGKPCLKLL